MEEELQEEEQKGSKKENSSCRDRYAGSPG